MPSSSAAPIISAQVGESNPIANNLQGETTVGDPASEPEQLSEVQSATSEPTTTSDPVQSERPGGALQRQQSVAYTDFDALLARLDREQGGDVDDGRHYEEYLTIQEVLGTAKPTNVISNADWELLSVARIEVESRRVDKNGKTKTKLSCAGVRVNKCTVSFPQCNSGT